MARLLLAILRFVWAQTERRETRFGQTFACEPGLRVSHVALVHEVRDHDAQPAAEAERLGDLADQPGDVVGRGQDAHALHPAPRRLSARDGDLVGHEPHELAHAFVHARQVFGEPAANELPHHARACLQLEGHENTVLRPVGCVGGGAGKVALQARQQVGLSRPGLTREKDRVRLSLRHAPQRGQAGHERVVVDRRHVDHGIVPGIDDHVHAEGIGKSRKLAHGCPRRAAPT